MLDAATFKEHLALSNKWSMLFTEELACMELTIWDVRYLVSIIVLNASIYDEEKYSVLAVTCADDGTQLFRCEHDSYGFRQFYDTPVNWKVKEVVLTTEESYKFI